MKYFYLSVLFISATFFATAQKKDSALLKQFKFCTPNFRATSIAGNSNGYFNTASFNSKNYSFSFSPQFNTIRIVSTDNELTNYNSEVSFSFRTDRDNTNPASQQNTIFNSVLKQSFQRKKYINANYFQTGYSVSLRQDFATNTNNFTAKENNLRPLASYTIGFGKGRIENVTDAQMAWNILSDLKNNNLLVSDFSMEDAISLAKTITAINNTRLFDFRRKRKFELQQIDSALHDRGLIKEIGIDYFTTITDNWFYAFNPTRRNGKEKYITLTPSISANDKKIIYKQPTDSTFKQLNKNAIVNLTIGYEKAVAKSIKRQFTKGVNLQTVYAHRIQKIPTTTPALKYETDNVFSSLNAFVQWAYYPNTRTSISTDLRNISSWQYTDKIFSNNTNLNFSGNYFINYNTRITASLNANFSYNRNNYYKQSLFNSGFTISIQHFIR